MKEKPVATISLMSLGFCKVKNKNWHLFKKAKRNLKHVLKCSLHDGI